MSQTCQTAPARRLSPAGSAATLLSPAGFAATLLSPAGFAATLLSAARFAPARRGSAARAATGPLVSRAAALPGPRRRDRGGRSPTAGGPWG